MRINILSRSLRSSVRASGPSKVVQNTIKGLGNLGVKVTVNGDIKKYAVNWVHDDLYSYVYAVLIQKPIIFGPNLVISPNGLPIKNKKPAKGSVCLVPSEWVRNAWVGEMGEVGYRVDTWAAGIDVDYFKPSPNGHNEKFILIYFKNRKVTDLNKVLICLESRGYKFQIFEYGKYIESDYLLAIQQAYFGIWISGTESQGMAMMEAMAANLPILVMDCKSIKDNHLDESLVLAPSFSLSFQQVCATSAPYFSGQCGVKIDSAEMLDYGVEEMERRLYAFSPRGYILDNHTLLGSSQKMMDIISDLPVNDLQISNIKQSRILMNVRCVYEIVFSKSNLIMTVRRLKRIFLRLLK